MHRTLAALAFCLAPLVAQAQNEGCRLALVLAIDVSSSVDKGEYALQKGGLASALIAPDVVRAFLASPRPVALNIFEWSGRYKQVSVQDWVLIRSRAHLRAVAESIVRFERSQTEFPTAMGYALGHAATLLERAPPCDARTVDISGDGINNEGFGPQRAYNAFNFAGVTVNGLVINGADHEGETDLISFYQTEVLHGAGAFLEVAQGFRDFERAMARKLEREVAPGLVGIAPANETDAPPPMRPARLPLPR
jgi:Protein of unknown function (DUF1194)